MEGGLERKLANGVLFQYSGGHKAINRGVPWAMGVSLNFILLGLLSYGLGSIPFGLLFVKMAGKGDVRQQGSGNIGATNVWRVGSKKLALVTFFADAVKGTLPILVGVEAGESSPTLCLLGALSIIGHIFPLWLGFRGGKGVATALGVYGALSPGLAFLVVLTWAGIAKLSRISSLAALVSFGLAPLYVYVFSCYGQKGIVEGLKELSWGVFVMMVITHRENIKRLSLGQERKISVKR